MSESLSLIADSRKLLAEFQTLCSWADEITICTSRIKSDRGRSPSWQALSKAKAKVLVIVSDGATDQDAFDELHKPASLRIVDCAKGRYRPNVYLFQQGELVRALIGTARLVPADFCSSLTVMVLWRGKRDDTFACELAEFVENCKRIARLPGSGHVHQDAAASGSRGWVFLGHPGSDLVIQEEPPTRNRLREQESGHGGDREPIRNYQHVSEPVRRSLSRPPCGSVKTPAMDALVKQWHTLTERQIALGMQAQPEPKACLQVKRELAQIEDEIVAERKRVAGSKPLASFSSDSVADPDSRVQFLSIYSLEEQILLARQILLGAGPLEKSEAIRRVAFELREQGRAEFKRLDRAGELYKAILEAIEKGLRLNNCFDRPQRGHVRAIQPIATEFDEPLWETCVLESLGPDFTSHQIAIRQSADWAKEMVGLRFDRLGSRIAASVSEAVDRLISRGEVEKNEEGDIRRIEN